MVTKPKKLYKTIIHNNEIIEINITKLHSNNA